MGTRIATRIMEGLVFGIIFLGIFAYWYIKYERIFHPIRFLDLLPLSHVFGQYMAIFIPPLIGGTVIFQDSFNPREIIAAIKSGRVSVLVAVPRVMESLPPNLEINRAGDFTAEAQRR